MVANTKYIHVSGEERLSQQQRLFYSVFVLEFESIDHNKMLKF